MNLLFPTQKNKRTDSSLSLEDFQPLVKKVKVFPDLKSLGNGMFRIKKDFINDLKEGQGWTCTIDGDTNKVYLVKVVDPSVVAPRFCVKKENNTITPTFKAQILEKALSNFDDLNFNLKLNEEQPVEGILLYEILKLNEDTEAVDSEPDEEKESEVAPLTDSPVKTSESVGEPTSTTLLDVVANGVTINEEPNLIYENTVQTNQENELL